MVERGWNRLYPRSEESDADEVDRQREDRLAGFDRLYEEPEETDDDRDA